MAVLQMERIHLLAMKRDRKAILELLQRRGIVEVSDAEQQDDVFKTMDTSSARTLLEKNAETAQRALEILAEYSSEKSSFLSFLDGRTGVDVKKDAEFAKQREEVLRAAQRVVQLDREISEGKADILRYDAQIEALKPWMSLSVPLIWKGTKKTAFFVGSIEDEHTQDSLIQQLAAAAPGLEKSHLQLIHSSKEQTCFTLLCLKSDAEIAEEALRSMGFSRPSFMSSKLPSDKEAQLTQRIKKANDAIEGAKTEIKDYLSRVSDIRYLQDHMTMRAEKYDVIEHLAQSKHVFALSGYVPAKYAQTLSTELDKTFTCSVSTQPVERSDDVPVLLQNSSFVSPGETVLENYSLPGKEDIDPTFVMSIFYYFMFGLMFSDAGYGLIMAAVCGILLLVKKNMEPNWRRNIGLFFWCGVSTVFWGVMFGSYFGDAIPVVTESFFGGAVFIRPLWLNPMENPMTLLMFCLGLGIIHLSMGMVLKAISLARLKQFSTIVMDVVFPLLAVYPLILALMGSEIFEGMSGFRLPLPEIVTTLCFAFSGIGVFGVLLTGGRESKNWFKRILKGAYALYNVLAGWLGDILSYSRLLALGLATGVIATVINSMGVMVGGGVVGFIAFLIIFALGQALNFGINVLGAYVHSNRLEFVELFGKFYEGGGRKFNPFGIHTKYYKIQEEPQNGTMV